MLDRVVKRILAALGLLTSYTVMTVASTVFAQAAALPDYTSVGIENVTTYHFRASATGDLHGYFAGEDAGYTSTLGLLVNGAQVASGLFSNHSTAVGAFHDFGHVNAGDRLTFFIQNQGGTYYSDTSMNNDGVNHVYASAFAGNSKVPAGTYVGFEDLYGGGDLDYNDLQFVFSEISSRTTSSGLTLLDQGPSSDVAISVSQVPVPAACPMFGAGLLVLGMIRYRKRRQASVA